jgi:hypothetical protein
MKTEEQKWDDLCKWSHEMLAARDNPQPMIAEMDAMLNMVAMEARGVSNV